MGGTRWRPRLISFYSLFGLFFWPFFKKILAVFI